MPHPINGMNMFEPPVFPEFRVMLYTGRDMIKD